MARWLKTAMVLWACVRPEPLWADPCPVPDAPAAVVDQVLTRWARPTVPLSRPSPARWTALLPARVTAGARDGDHAGTGYYLGVSGSESMRGLWGRDRALFVRAEWDLRPLWQPAALPETATATAGHAEKVEEIARRAAAQVKALRKAQIQALAVREGEVGCRDAQADAEAALIVLHALLAALQ
jgi:hypothetical protein